MVSWRTNLVNYNNHIFIYLFCFFITSGFMKVLILNFWIFGSGHISLEVIMLSCLIFQLHYKNIIWKQFFLAHQISPVFLCYDGSGQRVGCNRINICYNPQSDEKYKGGVMEPLIQL